MPTGKPTLYLLDAMALAYRAHFIFISRPLINRKGFNTSASYGFVSALTKLVEDHGMDHMAVVFDVMEEGGTFRDELYDEYKAHRDPPPDELLANLPYIKAIVEALDIPVIELGGVEADDVIGTLAVRAEKDGAEAVIVSPDKDFRQLLSDHVSQFRPAYRGESFDIMNGDTFREHYNLEPSQFIDLLALMGDSADNIPGVHGIGEKTAIKLIQQYGSVENLLEHADEVSGKRAREGLQKHAENAVLSKKLVTIRTDVDVSETWDDFVVRHPDMDRVRTLFDELEFSRLQDRVARVFARLDHGQAPDEEEHGTDEESERMGPERLDLDQVSYRTVTNMDALTDLVKELVRADEWAMDTETTSTDPVLASLVGLSFSTEERAAWYIPTPMPDGTPTETILEALRPAWEARSIKVGQNIKYDLVVLERHGVHVRGPFFDTMVAHYLCAPEEPHGMDHLAQTLLSYAPVPISELIGSGKDQRSMRDIPVSKVSPYACEDADITLRLKAALDEMLARDALTDMAGRIEFPLLPVLVAMEVRGVRIDVAELSRLSGQLAVDLERIQSEIHDMAGEEFNIGSPAQIGTILFEKLGLPVLEKTGTGKPSTRENVLQQLATEHELPARILDWRELSKLKSTYVDSLPQMVHPETGRIHTTYSQTTAATGRLASSRPNLQNIPIRTERGRAIRRAFVADPGYVLMSADYSQIELRILASLSRDDELSRAFTSGEDVHTATAALVFKVGLKDVTPDMRRRAKEVNYGIPYGISAFGLAQRLRCPVPEASELIDTYKRTYPGVANYLQAQVEVARDRGYAETAFGRRRYIPGIKARNHNVRSFAERVAVNMPIQGTQADMIKLAMITLHDSLSTYGGDARLLMQVHDELVLEVPQGDVDVVAPIVRRAMTSAMDLSVPVEVELSSGSNWLEAH
ncbi:MAG: DNA polymerase I [Bacteroidetes bacterium CG12_big_fil_rev_8_21_14_0_65_60_17]|nr:MAG: DNA polymerase I [Bacteroidetes bacterium CG12_big_fil_rev_8_21_14_0_65_60_17]